MRETINAQPAIVTVSLALLAAFQEALSPQNSSWSFPLVPSFTAGHSVGEYAALVASGALDLRSAALLVRERGRLMHHEGTVCPGGMAAIIGMDAEPLQDICQEATETVLAELASDETDNRTHHPGQGHVIVANFNAPGQIVISGEQQALNKAMDTGERTRSQTRHSPGGQWSLPFTCDATCRQWTGTDDRYEPIHDASIPVIGNIHALPLSDVAGYSDRTGTTDCFVRPMDTHYRISGERGRHGLYRDWPRPGTNGHGQTYH